MRQSMDRVPLAPYPWHALPLVSHVEARSEARVRAFGRRFTAARVGSELAALLGVPAGIVWCRHRWTHFGPNATNGSIGDETAQTSSPPPGDTVLAFSTTPPAVQLWLHGEAELLNTVSSWLVARRRRLPAASLPSDAIIEGAFAAVVVELCRRLGVAIVAGRGDATDEAPSTLLCVDASVSIANRAFPVQLRIESRLGDEVLCYRGAASLEGLPITVPVVAAWSAGTLGSLLGLRAGDVWLPGAGWHLDATWRGRAALVPPVGEDGPWVGLALDGSLVLLDEWARAPEEASMAENERESSPPPPRAEALERIVADAPVVVRVEVGAVTLPARRWIELAAGDVLTLEKPLGAAVVLRVASRAIAEGELVNVDGELGVRVRRVLSDEAMA